MIERLKVDHFYTTPAFIRHLLKEGEDHVLKHDLSSLKTIGSGIVYLSNFNCKSAQKRGRECLMYFFNCKKVIVIILLTVGEPLTEAAWEWYYKVVGKEKCTLVDTWWQTGMTNITISF